MTAPRAAAMWIAWALSQGVANSRLLLLPLCLVPLACSSGSDEASDAPGDPAVDAGFDALLVDSATNDDASEPDAALPAMLSVRIRATAAPFAHADGLSGQTPSHASGGIRSFSLLRDAQDPAPAVLFEYGADVEEASFDDGADTLLGATEVASVPAGNYHLARMVQAYSRYSIDATMHDGAGATVGQLDNLLVMGNGTNIDGQLRDAGYYSFVFTAPGQQGQTFEGDDALVPGYSTTAGAVAVVEDGQWVVYFPIQLDWSAGMKSAVDLVITVNMFESFRWTEVATPGFETGVFDITPLSYEPVVRFGGNEFIVTAE